MTFSIIARCPRTGQLGLAAASYSVAIGLYSDNAIRENTGVTLTQGFPNPRNNRLAIHLLAQGHREHCGGDGHDVALESQPGGKARPPAGSGCLRRPFAGTRRRDRHRPDP